MKENRYNRNDLKAEAIINSLIASHERVRIKATVARTGYRSSAKIIKPMVMFRNFTVKGVKISHKLVANYTKELCDLGELKPGDQIILVARFTERIFDYQYQYTKHDPRTKTATSKTQFIAPLLKMTTHVKRVKPKNPKRDVIPPSTPILAGYVMIANRSRYYDTVSYHKAKYFRDLYLGWKLFPDKARFSIKKWNQTYNRRQHLRYYKRPKDADNQNLLLNVLRQGVKNAEKLENKFNKLPVKDIKSEKKPADDNDIVQRMQRYLDTH